MPELLEPDVARRLLVTAATRQHTEAVQHMVQLAYLQQNIDAATLEAMLVALLKHNACRSALVQLPAADQLGSEAVIRLLQAAMQHADNPQLLLYLINGLPAAQRLSSEHGFQLLQAAVQHGNIWTAPYNLPAAQQLSNEHNFCLLQVVVPRDRVPAALYNLPAAQQLSNEQIFVCCR
jgi:hypothetical protein